MRRLAVLFLLGPALCAAAGESGQELMQASLRRHAQPAHVYEELALVLSDAGQRYSVRTLRHYLQRGPEGTRQVLVVDTPAEAKGVSLRVTREAKPLFDSDFRSVDLAEEVPADFTYQREAAQLLERVPHHVLRALPRTAEVARSTGYASRSIFLRQDNLFVSRIDFHDRQGRLVRRQSFRDPRPDDAGAWHANMVLMENILDGHRSLLKVERRIHSADYVPAAVFASEP